MAAVDQCRLSCTDGSIALVIDSESIQNNRDASTDLHFSNLASAATECLNGASADAYTSASRHGDAVVTYVAAV